MALGAMVRAVAPGRLGKLGGHIGHAFDLTPRIFDLPTPCLRALLPTLGVALTVIANLYSSAIK